MTKWLKANWFNLLQTLILTAGLVFAGLQVRDEERINSAKLVLSISTELNAPEYDHVETAIEGSSTNPVASTSPLLSAGISQSEIENYIGNFETVGDLMHDGLVEPLMVDDELGYDIEKAWCNHDVQYVLNRDREEDQAPKGTAEFWNGFELAAKSTLALDRKTCGEMDKE